MLGRRHVGHIGRSAPAAALSRPVDRYEVRLRRWLALTVCAATLLPIVVGLLVWNAADPAVSPTVISSARAVVDTPAQPVTAQTIGAPLVTVQAHWDWNGVRHDGVVAVPSGTAAGTNVAINVDQNGDWVGVASPAEKRMYATTAATVLAIFVSILIVAVGRERARHLLDRRHEQYWTESLRRFFATQPD